MAMTPASDDEVAAHLDCDLERVTAFTETCRTRLRTSAYLHHHHLPGSPGRLTCRP
jgi:hypothetical protein